MAEPAVAGGGAWCVGQYLLAKPLGLHRHCGVSAVNLQDTYGTDTGLTGATVHLYEWTQHTVTRDTQHHRRTTRAGVLLVYYMKYKCSNTGILLVYSWNTNGVLLL